MQIVSDKTMANFLRCTQMDDVKLRPTNLVERHEPFSARFVITHPPSLLREDTVELNAST